MCLRASYISSIFFSISLGLQEANFFLLSFSLGCSGYSSYQSYSIQLSKTFSTSSPNWSQSEWCCWSASCDFTISSLLRSCLSFSCFISLLRELSTSFSSSASELFSSSISTSFTLSFSSFSFLTSIWLKWCLSLPLHFRMDPISRLPITFRSSKDQSRSLGWLLMRPQYLSLSSGDTMMRLYSANTRSGFSASMRVVRDTSLQRCMGALSSQPPRFLRFQSSLSMLVISPASCQWKWSASVSWKMYFASNSFSSMKLGARQPAHTTNISADANRDAFGLVASTFSKNFLKTHMSDWKSVERKTLVMKQPPSRRKEQASLRAASTSSHWVLASLLQLAPTLGAPSLSTTSLFCPLVSLLSCSQQDWVVMSPWKLTVPWTLLMGSRSTPTMVEFMGMHSLATCIQPPGAAQRSMRTLAVPRKLYFRFSCMSLQAALDRYPCCLAK